MKMIITAITLGALLLLSGCGYKEGVASDAQKAYLYFTGNVAGSQVAIDNGTPFEVAAGKENRYQIKPGKHLVEVRKNSEVIVKRSIYVGDGIATEIEVQ